MGYLESEERHRRQPPERLLAAAGIQPGWRVADIGCGPGFYTLPTAALVGPQGRVFALDIEEAMLARVRERAAAAGLGHVIETQRSQESALPLGDAVADAAIVANVLHECHDRQAFLQEVARILIPGGRLVLVEWRKEPTVMGPPLAERLTEEEVRQALTAAGFQASGTLGPDATGATHFGVLATKPLA
jgi:ubiquinone/menaquinone biosynthesis C-methylase UbiE